MNKQNLLKKINENEQFRCLTDEELRLFLLMIAGSTETGEGKILPGQIGRAFGKDFSSQRVKEICNELKKKHLVRITLRSGHSSGRQTLKIIYKILE